MSSFCSVSSSSSNSSSSESLSFQSIIPSAVGFSRIDLISDEGLRQYWEELLQREGLSFHLKDLMYKIDHVEPNPSYSDRFCLLAHALQKNGVPLPLGIAPVARSHFRWVESKISDLDHSLVQIWNAIEPQIPANRRVKLSLSSTPNEKACRIRHWLQDEQYAPERHQIKQLLLSNMGLKIIPPEIGSFTGLTTLALDQNQIEKHPSRNREFKRIKKFDLK